MTKMAATPIYGKNLQKSSSPEPPGRFSQNSSLQCYSVLSDIWVKIELCIPLDSESSVLSTCNAFVCLSPPSKLKFAVLFCSICKGLISFSAILF